MAMPTPVNTALSLGQRIGRYFTLVSLVPSVFLVLWAYVLIVGGAASGHPSFTRIARDLSPAHWSVGVGIGLIIASFIVAIILHPLQFPVTQLLEGYWGTSPLAAVAMRIRIVHHRKDLRELRRKAGRSGRALLREFLVSHPGGDPGDIRDPQSPIRRFLKSERGDSAIRHMLVEQEARSRVQAYPEDDRVLPTRLGNALRAFEDFAGKQYGLDAMLVAPLLHLIAPDRHLEYLKDAREDMDSAIRICTVGLVATVLSVVFLMADGIWLLWAFLPYGVSYLAYRGAVSAAEEYGVVVKSVIDLDRFEIYDRLGLRAPRDLDEEKKLNENLMVVLSGSSAVLPYRRMDGQSPNSAWRKRKTEK